MRNLLLTIKYLGTAYHGWQVQANAVTVQLVLQDAIEAVFGVRENVTGCSRTDAGVHANKFCVNFRTVSALDCETVVRALNANLPQDVAVVACKEVPLEFHARYDCTGKEYIYKILNSPLRDPFLTGRCCEYKYPLDVEMLNSECHAFLGTHDFSAFCASGCEVEDRVRTVTLCEIARNGDEVIFRVAADGFLYNMVRIMVGTLIDISSGKIEKGTLAEIIDSKDRERAGITAPPQGLYLNKVFYGGFEA